MSDLKSIRYLSSCSFEESVSVMYKSRRYFPIWKEINPAVRCVFVTQALFLGFHSPGSIHHCLPVSGWTTFFNGIVVPSAARITGGLVLVWSLYVIANWEKRSSSTFGYIVVHATYSPTDSSSSGNAYWDSISSSSVDLSCQRISMYLTSNQQRSWLCPVIHNIIVSFSRACHLFDSFNYRKLICHSQTQQLFLDLC